MSSVPRSLPVGESAESLIWHTAVNSDSVREETYHVQAAVSDLTGARKTPGAKAEVRQLDLVTIVGFGPKSLSYRLNAAAGETGGPNTKSR